MTTQESVMRSAMQGDWKLADDADIAHAKSGKLTIWYGLLTSCELGQLCLGEIDNKLVGVTRTNGSVYFDDEFEPPSDLFPIQRLTGLIWRLYNEREMITALDGEILSVDDIPFAEWYRERCGIAPRALDLPTH